jgi:hypothetical protein
VTFAPLCILRIANPVRLRGKGGDILAELRGHSLQLVLCLGVLNTWSVGEAVRTQISENMLKHKFSTDLC